MQVTLDSSIPQLADLELLLTVNRLGSLGKAAREHNMSQPAASVRIQSLERRLGLRLLERSASGSRFTPAGTAIAKWAQLTVDAAKRLLACSTELNDANAGATLRMSSCMAISEGPLPRWLARFRGSCPDVSLSINTCEEDEAVANVRSGKVDISFVAGPPPESGIGNQSIGFDELAVVVSPEHPWAHRDDPLSVEELFNSGLVIRDRGFGDRETLARSFGADRAGTPFLELSSTHAIREAVALDIGPGLLNVMSIANELGEGRIVRVPFEGPRLRRPLRAVWDRATELGSTARFLLEIAMQERRERNDGRTPLAGVASRHGISAQPASVARRRHHTDPLPVASVS